jgi:hypothetical protein
MRTTVVGVFHDRDQASRAVEGLKRVGFGDDQIGLAGRDDQPAVAAGTQAEEGTVLGMLAGAGLGSLVGLGIVSGLVPPLGPVIAGGTLAAVLANAAGGAALVGLAGPLIGAGVPEEEARYYDGQFHAGRVILTVRADGRDAEATSVLRQHGAYDMHTEDVPPADAARRAGDAVADAEQALADPPGAGRTL